MKNPVYEQIQARKVKARLRMLQTCAARERQRQSEPDVFSECPGRCSSWSSGSASATTPYPLSHSSGVRFFHPPHSRGAPLWYRSGQPLSSAAPPRVRLAHYDSENIPPPPWRPRLPEEVPTRADAADTPLQIPGRSVQLDVKFVPCVGRARQRFYQFTAIDEATRFRVLRIYDNNNTKTAIDFLAEVREHFPFAIQKIQTDNDSSFGPQFTWYLSDLSISHRHVPAGCPEINGKVERNHKTDSEEFYRGKHFRRKKDLARKLKRWEAEYTQDRPHLALNGKTPAECVQELPRSPKPVRDLS